MAGSVRGWKGMIVAGAFGAVTFVGTIYGAGLKTQQDYKAVSFILARQGSQSCAASNAPVLGPVSPT